MKFSSLVEKSYYRFYKYIIVGKNRHYFYKGSKPLPQRIIFYLADRRVIHLGDSLWFEPIARFLSGSYPVSVCPIGAMEFYFRKLGYSIATQADINENCLLIAPIELMYKLKHVRHVLFLSFDYKLVGPGEKLINSMLNAVALFFNIQSGNIDGKYRALEYTQEQIDNSFNKFNLKSDRQYVFYNNYIDSWGKYTTEEMLYQSAKVLVNYARSQKTKNVEFIYIGSQLDKDNDKTGLDGLIDVDLRGKTTVEDLFMLVNKPQIIAYIGFDSFLLHLFNMYNKPSHILLKPGQPEERNQLIRNGVLVPYLSDNYPRLSLITPAQKILFIKRAALGDILMATPLIRQLKQKLPDVQLDFLVGKEFATILQNNPYVNNLISLPAADFRIKKIFSLIKFASKLRAKYDYVFILDKHYYFNFIGRLIGRNAIGYVRERISKLFLVSGVEYNDVMRYHSLYYLDLLKASKLAIPDYTDYSLDFIISTQDIKEVELIIKRHGLIKDQFVIIINSGGNNKFESGGIRMLPENKILGLIKSISADTKVVLLGGLVDKITYNNYLKLTNAQNTINLAGELSLEQSAVLMRYADKIYTTDCGAMHIAISQGLFTKLCCFFGPTCPHHVLPPKMGIAYYWDDAVSFDHRYPLYGRIPKSREYFAKLDINKIDFTILS